jgi:hypothetical protein
MKLMIIIKWYWLLVAALSLTGGIFVLYSVLRWSELRSFAYRLVSMLVLAQVIGAAVHLLPEAQSGEPLCYAQAYASPSRPHFI